MSRPIYLQDVTIGKAKSSFTRSIPCLEGDTESALSRVLKMLIKQNVLTRDKSKGFIVTNMLKIKEIGITNG